MLRNQKFYNETGQNLPVRAHFDVIVCGSGPAGCAAALAAARRGASVMLVEVHGCLGGVWTSGLLSWIIDAANKEGVMREIGDALEQRGARRLRGKNFSYDPEGMKLLLEDLCTAAGIRIRLHTRVAAVIRKGRAVQGILTESKSGREAWGASVLIDCTGDGEVGHLAGCETEYGEPDTGATQPMSLIALVNGIHADQIPEFVGGGVREAKRKLNFELQRVGHTCSYASPTLFPIGDDFFALMANHQYHVCSHSADSITDATIAARREINHLIACLKNSGHPWNHIRLVATAEQIGIREGRRIRGLYTITLQDLTDGVRQPDAICECTFGIDIHSTNPDVSKDYMRENRIASLPYEIPFRALIARDVDGLMMAGRCISGDFFAHSSYRVTGDATAMGEAAGVGAALAAATGTRPADLKWEDVRALRGF